MYTVQSHDGAVLGLTCSASYVISIGQDDKICVWDRFHGHKLNSIQIVRYFVFNNTFNFISINQFYFIFILHRVMSIVMIWPC